MRLASRFAAAILLTSTLAAQAWGPEGHRLVALVAQDHLTPAAREQVQILLGKQSMADVSSFADEYRVDHRETAPWHYVDIPLDQPTYSRERDCPASNTPPWRDCAPDRILYLVSQLKDPSLPRKQAIFDLKMLIHFVGDLHQPLHTTGDSAVATAS